VNMLSFAYMPIFSSEHSAREKGELYLDWSYESPYQTTADGRSFQYAVYNKHWTGVWSQNERIKSAVSHYM
jgi:hypothetical protein